MVRKSFCPFRNRALSAEAKLERRAAILSAADQLVLRQGRAAISVAEVAKRAGVAKGTVYLYFQTKEEIFLGLHELWVNRMLDAFTALLGDNRRALNGSIIGQAMAQVMTSEPHGLIVASTCHSLMETHIPLDSAFDFKMKLAQRLGILGKNIEQRFAHLSPGSGARLLIRAYATTLGLWQLMDTTSRWRKVEATRGLEVFKADFATELEAALVALWRGALDMSDGRAV
ncbi:MAG: TetR/AcrR family transcriptional regulator [Gammaproteobacteria bacterium]|nr:TetR/AcrR family transcriptional regulator [Gammaproteobacteria bacterium]